jgi:hypothetical protein
VNRDIHEGYARLPEDLLHDLLTGAQDIVGQVTDLLGPALDKRDELRQGLEALGLIKTYTPTQIKTVAGIDGGFAVERTAAVDLSLSVAVGVEGLSDDTTTWDSTQYQWWTRVSKHDMEAERLTRGIMVSQELAILANAPHQLRILDGSHLTLVIQLNTALTTMSDDLRSEARRVWERLETVDALSRASRDPCIIAMPKYDSSTTITHMLEAHLGLEIPGDDKYLLALLLQAGELIVPQTVPTDPWSILHFDARKPADEDLRDALQRAIEPLTSRAIQFTYFKPSDFSPAFRIELKKDVSEADLDAICSTLSNQITGPFVREPYPQYLADVMAKSVGLGLSALQTAVQTGLSRIDRPEMAELLIHSYRTEGV